MISSQVVWFAGFFRAHLCPTRWPGAVLIPKTGHAEGVNMLLCVWLRRGLSIGRTKLPADPRRKVVLTKRATTKPHRRQAPTGGKYPAGLRRPLRAAKIRAKRPSSTSAFREWWITRVSPTN